MMQLDVSKHNHTDNHEVNREHDNVEKWRTKRTRLIDLVSLNEKIAWTQFYQIDTNYNNYIFVKTYASETTSLKTSKKQGKEIVFKDWAMYYDFSKKIQNF